MSTTAAELVLRLRTDAAAGSEDAQRRLAAIEAQAQAAQAALEAQQQAAAAAAAAQIEAQRLQQEAEEQAQAAEAARQAYARLRAEADAGDQAAREALEAMERASREAREALERQAQAAREVTEQQERAEAAARSAQQETERRARESREALDRQTEASRRAGDAAGDMGGRAGRAAGALGMLSPAAGESANSLADLADIAEIASEAAVGMGLSLQAVMVGLGAVAAVVAIGAAAWMGYAEEAANAERIGLLLTDMRAGMEPVLASTADAVLDLKVALGELSEAEAKARREAQATLDTWADSTEAARKRVAELRRDLADDQSALVATNRIATNDRGGFIEGFNPFTQGMTDLVGSLQSPVSYLYEQATGQEASFTGVIPEALDYLTTTTSEKQEELEQLEAGIAEQTAALQENRLAREALAEAEATSAENAEREKTARAGSTSAAKEEAEAKRAAAQAEAEAKRQEAEAARQAQQAATAQASAEDLLASLTGARLDPLQAISAAYGEQSERLDELLSKGASLTTVEAARAAAAQNAVEAIFAAQRAKTKEAWEEHVAEMEQVAGAISAVGGGAQGLVGLLGQAGPGGAIAAASIGALSSMGQTDEEGNNLFVAQSQEFLDGIVSGVDQIGPALGGLIGAVLGDFLPALVETLVDPTFWWDVATSLVEAIVGGLVDLGQRIWEAVNPFDEESRDRRQERRERRRDDYVGSFASGTDGITRDGWARVHEGERIIPATGTGSGRTTAMMGAGAAPFVFAPTIVGQLSAAQVDDLARQFRRQSARGVSFGGG